MFGGLNRCDPHGLMCLNAWLMYSSTIRKYGLVGIGVALLEKVCHWGAGFEISYAQGMPNVEHSLYLAA